MRKALIDWAVRVVLSVILLLSLIGSLFYYSENIHMSNVCFIGLLLTSGMLVDKINNISLKEWARLNR